MPNRAVGGSLALLACLAAALAVFAAQSLSVLAILAALALFAAARGSAVLRRPAVLLPLAVIVLVALSALWSLAPARSLQTAAASGVVILAAGFAAAVPAERRLAVAGPAVLVLFGLAALLLVVEIAGQGHLRALVNQATGTVPRRWGVETLSRPVVLVCLVAWGAALCLAGWYRAVPLIAAAAVTFVAHLYTARIGFAAGLLAALLAWWLGPRLVRLAGWVAAAVMLAMPLIVRFALVPSQWEWLAGVRNSGLHRLYIWQFVNGFVGQRPLWGWGAEASRSLPGGEATAPSGGQLMQLHPHNGAMQVWVELGGLGALLAAAIIVVFAMAIARLASPAQRALGLGLFVTALSFWLFSFGIWQAWWLGALAMGIAAFKVAAASPQSLPPAR
jgi:O-antigen ligase